MVNRRQFHMVLLSTALAGRLARAADDATDNAVEFSWIVNEAHHDFVESILSQKGEVTKTQDTDTKGGLVVVFSGLIALPYLADALLKLRDRLVRPGLKIDARGKKILIEIDPILPHGYILLVDNAGSHLFAPSEIKDPAEMIEKLAAHK